MARRSQVDVLSKRLEECGYILERVSNGYEIYPEHRPDAVDYLETLSHVRDRVRMIEEHPVRQSEFITAVNEISLKYHPKPIKNVGTQISDPYEAVKFLMQIWEEDTIELKESFYVVALNNAKKVVGYYHLSFGGMTATIVDPAEVMRIALLTNANSILLAHNHPSGNMKPSKADRKLTERIAAAGKIMGIEVDDHIIISAGDYVSMRMEGTTKF